MTFWNRVTGKVVDTAGLGQKRRAVTAGLIAFDGPKSDLRLEIAIKSHPWLQDSATGTFLLTAWAAQALQDMGAVLEATAQRVLGEHDRLPEATFLLANVIYDAALWWVEQAQSALIGVSSRRLEVSLRLPASAPRFDYVADALPAHYVAAIEAAGQLGVSVEEALNTMREDRSRLPTMYDGAFSAVESSLRVGRAKLDQVEAAGSDRQAIRLGRDIWAMLAEVVRLFFLAGQQANLPALIDRRYDAGTRAVPQSVRLPPPPARQPASAPSPAAARPAPPRSAPPPPPPTLGQRLGLGFDAWALTDQGARATYHNDPQRIAELEAFWRADPDPGETYRLYELITAAVRTGRVAARPGEFSRSSPWISTFVALGEVSIGSETFANGALFTLAAGRSGGIFGRRLERLGFIPGTQPRKQATAPPSPAPPGSGEPGRPAIDTRYHGDRKPKPPRAQPATEPDIWMLTAAFQRPQRRANAADTDKLRRLWLADPDPAATVAFHGEVQAALAAGTVRRHGDEALREAPWSQVYLAVRPVTIGGVQLRANEKFALDIGVRDGQFRRDISRLGLISPSRD